MQTLFAAVSCMTMITQLTADQSTEVPYCRIIHPTRVTANLHAFLEQQQIYTRSWQITFLPSSTPYTFIDTFILDGKRICMLTSKAGKM